MLLGRLFLRLDNKKMNMGQFLAELIQLIHAQIKTNKQLEDRIAQLESIINNELKKERKPHV